MSETVHATTVALGEAGVMIRGAPGAGKTTLALALVAAATAAGRYARLVADDATLVEAVGGRLVARTPEAIAGLVEVRGLGLVRVPHAWAVRLALVVDLVPRAHLERMPDVTSETLLGVALPRLAAETCNTVAATFAVGAVLSGPLLTTDATAAQRPGSVGALDPGLFARHVRAGDGS